MSGRHPAWHDPALGDPSDSFRRARYRRKQSWYREVVLGAAPGRDADGRLRGNLLAAEDVAARPGLAFLDDAKEHATGRLQELGPNRVVDTDALHRDLLSPLGVAFNLLTPFCHHPRAAARVLRNAFRLDAARLERLDVEPERPSGESGWLDALAIYTTAAGRLGFLGLVTRYADAPPRLDPDLAHEHHDTGRLSPGAFDRLASVGALDLWAAVLEVAVLLERSPAVVGHLGVVATSDDAATWQAVETLRHEAIGADLVVAASYGEVLAAVVQRDGLSAWADAFAARYLDMAAVEEH